MANKGLLLFAALAALVTLAVLLAALRTPFRDTVVSRLPSPDGKFLAVHFTRAGGAAPSHHVVIQPAEDKFRVRESETVFVAERLDDLRLHWEGARILRIDFDGGHVLREEGASHGVRILFNGAPKPEQDG